MKSKRAGCLVSLALLAVLAGGAALVLSATGDREGVNADLIIAAKEGNITDLKSLLDRGADPNAREFVMPDYASASLLDRFARLFRSREAIGQPGDSALTDAVHSLHPYEAAAVLVQHGATAKTGLLGGAENVHEAARIGDSRTVALLIEHGASVKMPPNHFTDLRTDMLMLLAAHGADVPPPADAKHIRPNPHCYSVPLTDRDREFLTAVKRDDIGTVRRLLSAGEDFYLTDKHSVSALDIAAYKGYRDLLELFVQHGADINDAVDSQSRTPLIFALQNRETVPGRLYTIRFLVEHGAEPNALDIHAMTVLRRLKTTTINDAAAIEALLKEHGGEEKAKPKRMPGMGMSGMGM